MLEKGVADLAKAVQRLMNDGIGDTSVLRFKRIVAVVGRADATVYQDRPIVGQAVKPRDFEGRILEIGEVGRLVGAHHAGAQMLEKPARRRRPDCAPG